MRDRSRFLRLDQLLPPLSGRQLDGGLLTYRVQQDIRRIGIRQEQESCAALRRRGELHTRTPVAIDQPQDHGFGVCPPIGRFVRVIGRLNLDARSNTSLIIDDLERATTKHRFDALRVDGPDLPQQEHQEPEVDDGDDDERFLNAHACLLTNWIRQGTARPLEPWAVDRRLPLRNGLGVAEPSAPGNDRSRDAGDGTATRTEASGQLPGRGFVGRKRELAALTGAVRTGRSFSYTPDPLSPVRWQI